MTGEGTEPLYKGEAIERAARVLGCFSPARAAWSLEALSAATAVPRATLLGILDTLVLHGMLRRDGEDGYRLGFAWLRLGALRRGQMDMRGVALPIMRRIRDLVDETVILSVRDGDQRVHLDYAESKQPFRRLTQVGNSRPLHVGAAGMALLACLPRKVQADYMARLRATLAPAAHARVEDDLAAARREGCAIAIGTVHPMTGAVAAGARLYAGDCVAITISCPVERVTDERAAQFADLVKDAVRQLSLELGGDP